MADPASYRPAPGSIPDTPGVYRFRDPDGRVIYVGKAKSLRGRLQSYFADPRTLHRRTRTMVETAAGVEWTVVRTEGEALQLEYAWIKEFEPRFNVRYRDDKSYPYLAVSVGERFPRLSVTRGPRRSGVRYFGPYPHAWAIRDTLDTLLRVFPARTCSAGVFQRAARIHRPCLLADLGKCAAPCVGRVSEEEHRRIVEEFCEFLGGRPDDIVRRLEDDMQRAAANLDYERAARVRDDLAALRRALEKQAVVLADSVDADVVGVSEDALEASVQVFHVRQGRVRGQRGWMVEKVEELTSGELVGRFLGRTYGAETALEIPREILVPHLPPDAEAVQEWLSERRGGPVVLRVPKRGDKRALLETVERNAGEAFTLHKLRRAGDLTARSQALEEVRQALGMPVAPLRIECFDVSTLQGTQTVASMVVFEDGLARRADYRRFAIRGSSGQTLDDVAALREAVVRRFTRPAERIGDPEAAETPVRPPRRFAYPPQLVVLDGGAPQVAGVCEALATLGVTGVTVCGLAKRLEEVWLPGREEPVILSRSSEGLYLLQRIRDEAHRFAITYHRSRRSVAMTASELDTIPGVGQTRRRALVRHFGSVRRLREASVAEVAAVPGVGPATAQAVVAALAGARAPRPAVDAATGEVLDAGASRSG